MEVISQTHQNLPATKQILTDYPEELRGDVSLHLHKEILSLPIFETASEGCRKLLSLTIKVWKWNGIGRKEMVEPRTERN